MRRIKKERVCRLRDGGLLLDQCVFEEALPCSLFQKPGRLQQESNLQSSIDKHFFFPASVQFVRYSKTGKVAARVQPAVDKHYFFLSLILPISEDQRSFAVSPSLFSSVSDSLKSGQFNPRKAIFWINHVISGC
jgi:hypothetical protein